MVRLAKVSSADETDLDAAGLDDRSQTELDIGFRLSRSTLPKKLIDGALRFFGDELPYYVLSSYQLAILGECGLKEVKFASFACLSILLSTPAAWADPQVFTRFTFKAGDSDVYNQVISWPNATPFVNNAFCAVTHFQLPNDESAQGAWVIVAPIFEGEASPWGISVSKGVTAHASCVLFE